MSRAREDEAREDEARGDGRGDGRDGRHDRISAAEWAVAALGLVLVVATIGFLLVDVARDAGQAPALTVQADSVTTSGGRWMVHFTARNAGRGTAASVGIVGELQTGAGAAETSRATLDYLPGRSTRRGGLSFGAEPLAGRLRLWAEGYREP